jgi:hypothetical protein
MAREVAIRGDTIRLGQLLKLAGVVEGGDDAKSSWGVRTCGSTASARDAAAGSCIRVTRGGSALRSYESSAEPSRTLADGPRGVPRWWRRDSCSSS